jgi:glycosyltransferase involved in cell wall biosynthesis
MVNISVIIPAFNAEDYIEEALTSVFSQTYKNFEVIVINDGSTDKTKNIVMNISKTKRLEGVSAARQLGIKHSLGKFIAFLDADDLWHHEKLAKQLMLFDKNSNAGLVYTDMVNFCESGKEKTTLFQQKRPAKGFVLNKLFYGNFVPTPTVLVRKEAVEKCSGFNPHIKINEDVDLFLRLSEFIQFDFVNEVLVFRRMHKRSLIHSYPEKIHQQDLEIIKYWSQRRPDYFDPKLRAVRRRKGKIHFRLGEAFLNKSCFNQSRSEFISALKEGYFNGTVLFKLICSIFPQAFIKLKRCTTIKNAYNHYFN